MTQSVLITGGAQRLGAELVRRFAANHWDVWCHYQHSKAAAEQLSAALDAQGMQIRLVQADLSSPEDMTSMMNHVCATTGPLTALVNNASTFEPDHGTDFTFSTTRKQLDVNLIAPMFLGQALARQYGDQTPSDACVIHILDQKVFNLNPDYFSYTLSKLALERAVALQAQALAPQVRVCGVAPGLMFLSGPQSQENFDMASRVNLLRKRIDPADVAKTCVFLASTPSINGAIIQVDNGQHLVPLDQDVMFKVDQWLKATQ